jgi:hypothetical protein
MRDVRGFPFEEDFRGARGPTRSSGFGEIGHLRRAGGEVSDEFVGGPTDACGRRFSRRPLERVDEGGGFVHIVHDRNSAPPRLAGNGLNPSARASIDVRG